MIRILNILIISILSLITTQVVLGQSCELPFVINFSDLDTTSIQIHWIDGNQGNVNWDIELGIAGFNRNFQPSISSINTKNFTYPNLESGIRYEFYLRAICESGLSEWNGPYFFNTNISNPSSCILKLPIEDNNCPAKSSFYIATNITDDLILGKDIFLEAVDISLTHPWTPDLEIELVSPSGQKLSLFKNRGIHNANLGNIPDEDCNQYLRFTEIACDLLSDTNGPFVGEFKPEESLNILNQSLEIAHGIWELNICDRAFGDVGSLNHIALIFSEEACQLPENIFVSDVDGEQITINWTHNTTCQDVELTYGLVGFDPNQATIDFVECDKESFTIGNLEPATSYEIYFESICSDQISIENCPFIVTTACGISTLTSNFDQFDDCTPNCNRRCFVADSVWHNSTENQIDWILFSGATPSSFTGPSGDVNNQGSYIYLESQPEACGNSYSSIFESNCLTIGNAGSNCGMSFYYHMYGQSIDSLKLEINVNESDDWITLWSAFGDKGNQWNFAKIDLSSYVSSTSRIRFVAHSNGDNLGDIAIDQIKLFGSTINEALFTFYEDADNDGFGNSDSQLIICQSSVPNGFVTAGGDCNDLRADIFPGANEFPCNLVDENCNGMEDDNVGNNIGFIQELNTPATCSGIDNGSLTIIAFGGTGNYSYRWSNGETGRELNNLATGLYHCTITDLLGCVLITPPFFIDAIETLSYALIRENKPQCKGVDNGLIEILVGGGTLPYTVTWNNNQSGSLISGLKGGLYTANISDFFGCNIQTDTIKLFSDPEVIPGIQIKSNASCYLASDGNLLANVTGGRPPYHFEWSTGDTTSFVGNLSAGNYSLSITDTEGCVGILNEIEIGQADSLQIILDAVEQVRCFSEENGRIEITVLGGNPPYTYFWSDNNFSSDRINVPSGAYNLTVTDSKSCSVKIENIQIVSNPEIKVFVDEIKNVSCLGSKNGFAKIRADGGTPPYLYSWNNGEQTDKIENLSIGNYSVTVIDQFECKAILGNLEIVSQNLPLDIDVILVTDVLCNDDTTAAISASVNNAIGPFDFNWSTGVKRLLDQPRDTLFNLAAGSYNLTVTDGNGCIGIENNIETKKPSEISYLLDIKQSPCFGFNNASISISIQGGTPGYDVQWDHGESGAQIGFLEDGIYQATVTDKNLCQVVIDELEIKSPEMLIVAASVFGNNNGEDGSITLFVDGGIPPYKYSWNGPTSLPSDSILINLNSGTYFLTVEDAKGCEFENSYVIDNTTNTQSQDLISFKIFPNPASDKFRIETTEEITKIELLDLNGKLIWLSPKGIKEVNLSTEDIAPGLYVLCISFDAGLKKVTKILLTGGF